MNDGEEGKLKKNRSRFFPPLPHLFWNLMLSPLPPFLCFVVFLYIRSSSFPVAPPCERQTEKKRKENKKVEVEFFPFYLFIFSLLLSFCSLFPLCFLSLRLQDFQPLTLNDGRDRRRQAPGRG